MTENQQSSNNILVQIIIVLITAIVTTLANQMFFIENKQEEAKIDLNKDLIKEQYEKLNRILNFSYRYKELFLTTTTIVQHSKEVQYIDRTTGKILKTEKTGVIKRDTLQSVNSAIPSFLAIEKDRKDFDSNLKEIINSKNQVKHSVAIKIDDLLDFLDKHPLPDITNKTTVAHSDWSKKEVKNAWINVMTNLYTEANNILYD